MDFKSLQKLRFFLGAIAPALVRMPRSSSRLQAWIARHPAAAARLEKWRQSRAWQNLIKANESYGLGYYASGVLDWSMIPAGSVAVMRAGVIGATLLSLLIPLAMLWVAPPLEAEAITGSEGPAVAGWSVILWMAGVALGWGALLIGTGISNRYLLLPAVTLFLYSNAGTVGATGRSWWNLSIVLAAAWALVFAEARTVAAEAAEPSEQKQRRPWAGWIVALGGGMLVGLASFALTPLGKLVPGRVLVFGLASGPLVGAALWWCGRQLGRRARRGATTDTTTTSALLRPDLAAAIVLGHQLVFFTAVSVLDGLTTAAGGIRTLAIMVTGYLWPLYYFIGVGIIFRLLRQTKFIHGLGRDLLPAVVFVPAGVLFLVAGVLATWAHLPFLYPSIGWPSMLLEAAAWIHQHTRWMWAEDVWRFSRDGMRWVFLVASVVALWAALRRRLNSETMAAILFPTILLWLAIAEYYFEFLSFGRSPLQSPAGLLGFAIFVLWLVHITLRPFLTGRSSHWSDQARVLIYVAALMFTIAPLHARAALHDHTLANEIFLYLFFGILDLGIPYYLFVYASRRFVALPFGPRPLLGLFLLGAGASVVLIVADKLALGGWSWTALWNDVAAQVDGMLRDPGWKRPPPSFLPGAWVFARSLIVMAAMVAAGAWARARFRGEKLAPAAIVFAVMAVASGMASFSNRAFELPLMPNSIVVLITPVIVSHTIDAALLARFFAYLIPAFLLVLSVSAKRRWPWAVAALFAGWLVHWAVTALYPAQEPWLHSSGVFVPLGALGMVVLLALLAAVRGRLDTVLEAKEANATNAPIIPSRHLQIAAIALAMLLTGWAVWRQYQHRLVAHAVLDPAVTVHLPAIWHGSPTQAGPTASFSAPTTQTLMPLLTLEWRTCEDGNARDLLDRLVTEVSPHLPQFYSYPVEDWGRFERGVVALEYQFGRSLGTYSVTVFGTVMIRALEGDRALVANVLYEVADRDRRWDLARMLRVPTLRR